MRRLFGLVSTIAPVALVLLYHDAPRQTLERVNRTRLAAGKPPLTDLQPGKRRSPTRCPLAVSLPDSPNVYEDYIQWVVPHARHEVLKAGWGGRARRSTEIKCLRMPLDPSSRAFVWLFDHGFYRRYRK